MSSELDTNNANSRLQRTGRTVVDEEEVSLGEKEPHLHIDTQELSCGAGTGPISSWVH